MGHSSHFLNVNSCVVTISQSMQCGKEHKKSNFPVTNLTNTALVRCSKSPLTPVNHIESIYLWYDVMKMVLYLWGLPQHMAKLPCNHKNDIREIFHKDTLQKPWPALLKSVKVTKNKGSLKNCHSLSRSPGRRDTKCNTASQRGFQNRRRPPGKNSENGS